MFCPKCATQNVEGASYCRTCGSNIRLVPQALSGQLANQQEEDRYYDRQRGRRGASTERAIRSLFMGVAFATMIALTSAFSTGKTHWYFWLILPAMLMFSRGFAELIRLRVRSGTHTALQSPLSSARPLDLSAAKTGELMTAAPSVTEGTTRLLENEPGTRQR